MSNEKKLTWNGISDYLSEMGIKSQIDISRVKEIFNLGSHVCPEAFRQIFISNYIESNGREQFKDIWFFSQNYVFELLNFGREEILKPEMSILSDNIEAVAMEIKNYDFSDIPYEDARLRITIHLLGDFECDFMAAGRNCAKLKEIYEKYIKHNLSRSSSSTHQR